MSDDDKTKRPTLTDEQVKVTRDAGRRSFLRSLGIGILGAAALVAAPSTPAAAFDTDDEDAKVHHDFPKGNADGDVTTNADLKAQDSDDNDARADNDQSHLRDAQGSQDSD